MSFIGALSTTTRPFTSKCPNANACSSRRALYKPFSMPGDAFCKNNLEPTPPLTLRKKARVRVESVAQIATMLLLQLQRRRRHPSGPRFSFARPCKRPVKRCAKRRTPTMPVAPHRPNPQATATYILQFERRRRLSPYQCSQLAKTTKQAYCCPKCLYLVHYACKWECVCGPSCGHARACPSGARLAIYIPVDHPSRSLKATKLLPAQRGTGNLWNKCLTVNIVCRRWKSFYPGQNYFLRCCGVSQVLATVIAVDASTGKWDNCKQYLTSQNSISLDSREYPLWLSTAFSHWWRKCFLLGLGCFHCCRCSLGSFACCDSDPWND
jgi:hypothetical protein